MFVFAANFWINRRKAFAIKRVGRNIPHRRVCTDPFEWNDYYLPVDGKICNGFFVFDKHAYTRTCLYSFDVVVLFLRSSRGKRYNVYRGFLHKLWRIKNNYKTILLERRKRFSSTHRRGIIFPYVLNATVKRNNTVKYNILFCASDEER